MDSLRSFGFLVKEISRLSTRNFERIAAEARLELTIEQCKVLIHLERNQGISQAGLAYLTDTDPMTLMRIIDRMEADGWVQRRPDPEDRRARRLHLKPAAQPVMQRIWNTADRARSEALAGLDAAERTQLIGLLGRVHDNLIDLVGAADSARRREGTPRKSPARAPRQRIRSTA